MPYGIREDQFSSTITSQGGIVAQPFVIRIGFITGKVIDYTQTIATQPFSRVVDIDDELENLATTQNRKWWDCTLPSEPSLMTEFRAKVVEQCVYWLARMYLHLPCVLKPQSSHMYKSSRLTGLHSARELTKRYHTLRTSINGESVFDSKTLDFVGFMASMVLLLGDFNSNRSQSQAESSDRELVNTTISLLHQLTEEKQCKIASQCQNCLEDLVSLYRSEGRDMVSIPTKITIPYFGILHISTDLHSSASHLPLATEETQLPDIRASGNNFADELHPMIDYQGLYSMDTVVDWQNDNAGMDTNPFGQMMDLDQDWGNFFNSGLEGIS